MVIPTKLHVNANTRKLKTFLLFAGWALPTEMSQCLEKAGNARPTNVATLIADELELHLQDQVLRDVTSSHAGSARFPAG